MEVLAVWEVGRRRGLGVRDSVKVRKVKLIEGEQTEAWACVGHVAGPIWRVVL